MKNRFIIISLSLWFFISIPYKYSFGQDSAYIKELILIYDTINDNTIKVGPHIDGAILTDTVSGEEYGWATTYYKMNDSNYIREYVEYYKNRTESLNWCIWNDLPVVCLQAIRVDSNVLQIDYYFKNRELIWINHDTITAPETIEIRKRKVLLDLKNIK